ncbi:Sorting and assembly machinery component 50 homolog [Geodia barretti]|uniref:Sorting and assembly machinery component 50 homolog n=1 Tax=Geodia barretti TaxID=519541 RepID=A0AA35WNG2_GEOBA|nr:Sorting and assembly machinery component 50 homolog [Geodia barretti]
MGLEDEGMMLQVPDIKVHVSQVKISGLVRTKNDIVVEQIKDVLKANRLQDVLLESVVSMEKLNSLNVFKSINIRLDATNGEEEEGGGDSEKGVIVTFQVREKKRVKSSLGANVGTQSGDMSLSLNAGNVFGRAEEVSLVSMTTFPHWGQSSQLQFTKPYYKNLNNTLHLSLATTHTKRPFSGYQERSTGPGVAVRFPSRLGTHTLAWNGDWRNIHGFNHDIPMSLRSHAGHSLKSSLRHSLEIDERDSPFLPSSGFHVKVTQELAGIGGDVFFGKSEVQGTYYQPLPAGWVFALSLWGGILRPYSNNHLPDRFLLGGGTTLRGFGMWGVGPREQGYSKGGESYWASGVHIFAPLPLITNAFLRRIKLHSFLTAGNLIESATLPSVRSLFHSTRVSCGLGLCTRLGLAQIELNYALPLLAQKSDSLQPGLQFGVGMDML